MTRDDKKAYAHELATALHGKYAHAWLWGSTSALLPETELDVIIRVLETDKAKALA
jgi:hypothetical protein